MSPVWMYHLQSMVADINNPRDCYFFPQIVHGSAAQDGQGDPGKIPQFLQMPPCLDRTESQSGSRCNWSEGSIIVQKKEKTLGLLNPGLNVFPTFKKMLQGIFLQRELICLDSLVKTFGRSQTDASNRYSTLLLDTTDSTAIDRGKQCLSGVWVRPVPGWPIAGLNHYPAAGRLALSV